MSGKDGKNDPQDTPKPLFPMDSKERVEINARIAQRLERIRYLEDKLRRDAKPIKEELARLKKTNDIALDELQSHEERAP